jgi:choline transport protein
MLILPLASFLYAIAILYGITNLSDVVTSNGSFPLAAVYAQATGNNGATFGLLLIICFSLLICVIGTFLTVGRIWWTLARDNATPFSQFFSRVDEKRSCPIPATLLCAILCTGLGAIPLGSQTAFSDLAGSFVILTTSSYVVAIAPHFLTGRKNVPPGPFWLGRLGMPITASAVLLMIFFNIMFCFRECTHLSVILKKVMAELCSYFLASGLPTTVSTMNYNSVILVGVLFITTVWWIIHGFKNYPGPKLVGLYLDGVDAKDE